MNAYYTRTFVGMAVVLGVLAVGAVLANSAAAEARARQARLLEQDAGNRLARQEQRSRLTRLRATMEPVQAFAAAWRPFALLPEKDAAERIRSDLESIAQRQLGLVTDNAITPQPDRFIFQALPIRVQRVTLRASGKDLAALMTWLGKVEERYPAALVEGCEFSSNVGGNTGLTLRLVQPVHPAADRMIMPRAVPETALSPDSISALGWPRYLPARVKAAVAVGFTRNPLQPAVASDQHPIPALRDDRDEITPRLEGILGGKVRSVIRGPQPIVVIDGRVFRVGDEIVIGAARERPIPEVKTKLKGIGDDRLVFHVAGGGGERAIQCDVTLALPSFLHAR